MPSYLDFDSTKKFRDYIIGKTLQSPVGPQTFTNSSYSEQNLGDLPNKNQGPIDSNLNKELLQTSNSNIYKPDVYFLRDNIDTLPRRANLSLYPYFQFPTNDYSLVGIMATDNYNNESELFKFAASYIKNDPGSPVLSRIARNIDTAVNGRIRLLDALNGNTATAANIITGKEPLVEANNKITVAKTLPGKAIDFLQTVAGVEFPWSEIPGDYLSNPKNPINYRPTPTSELGAVYQDVTGALGSLIGIQRRPQVDRKPSDLLIEYMGEGQKTRLFDLLSYSKYAPNYTTTARSQNSSKIFSFIDKMAQGVKSFLGMEAPVGGAYIGDDRGDDLKWVMNEMVFGRPVKSSYYLSEKFDSVAATIFQRTKNISQGGPIAGNLTWISSNSQNKKGVNNSEWSSESSKFEDSLSTKYGFRQDSILDITQQILNSMPANGGESRSHVGNVIDQTSRVFKDGDVIMSRGSAIQYVDKLTNEPSGVEYCRVWTKDRSYMNYSDTMKRTANIRKMDASVMGGDSRPWNLNIGPISNGNKGFDNSTNIFSGSTIVDKDGKSFYAKKYMFSLENLAWKTSNRPGYSVSDLPYCERGPNGGRVMWFPPYDLKVSEQNSARWESNTFLGRPEPIYTYQNTERSGQISFKVVVDHPSIMNLLVREHFKNMSDEQSENYINAFFAGCKDVDLYSLVRLYTTLDISDVDLIKAYLNDGGSPTVIPLYGPSVDPVVHPNPSEPPKDNGQTISLDVNLKFLNNEPLKTGNNNYTSNQTYSNLYNGITGNSGNTLTRLHDVLDTIYEKTDKKDKADKKLIFGSEMPPVANKVSNIQTQVDTLTGLYTKLSTGYTKYDETLAILKKDISGHTVDDVTIDILSTTSAVADNSYNFYLSIRRSHALLQDILTKVSKDGTFPEKWVIKDLPKGSGTEKEQIERKYTYKELGYDREGTLTIKSISAGENVAGEQGDCHTSNFNNTDLKKDTPVAFGCRQSYIRMSYKQLPTPPKNDDSKTEIPGEPPKTKLVRVGSTTIDNKPKKPTIDLMKRVVMKALSECYYFKKLEETDPVVFGSLKEKLKYFHPGFHSTTPEGLNSRLTFLQQCIRPGDTIPVKGMTDTTDLNARNTTFGPPPICVLRIGDFYHSKIVIRDVGITFEDGLWDLNPEGIGVQPMIANVSLQVNFIGGQGLEKPVEQLQNALSSNFYANTEMYDERSTTTNTLMGGVDAKKFTKEFLENMLNFNTTNPSNNDNKGNKLTQGNYVGQPSNGEMIYSERIQDVYLKTKNYFDSYSSTYNRVLTTYGPKVMGMFFSPTYKKVSSYDVYTSSSGTDTINLFGIYDKTKDISILNRGLKTAMVTAFKNTKTSILIGLENKFSKLLVDALDKKFDPFIKKFIEDKVDEITNASLLTTLDNSRDELISSLDKLNYVTKNGFDVKLDKGIPIKATLTGFTDTTFYDEYSTAVDYIKQNSSKLTPDLDTTIDFNTPTVDIDTLRNFIGSTIKSVKSNFMELFDIEEDYTKIVSDQFDKLLVTNTAVDFKFTKFTDRKNQNKISYGIVIEDIIPITDDITKLYSNKVEVTDKLNYYKK